MRVLQSHSSFFPFASGPCWRVLAGAIPSFPGKGSGIALAQPQCDPPGPGSHLQGEARPQSLVQHSTVPAKSFIFFPPSRLNFPLWQSIGDREHHCSLSIVSPCDQTHRKQRFEGDSNFLRKIPSSPSLLDDGMSQDITKRRCHECR